MKRFIIIIILFLPSIIFAQVAISPKTVKTLRDEAEKWVQTYSNNLNSLGSPYKNPMEKTMIIENTLRQFEGEDVVVYNDLDLSGKTQKDQKVRQYLGNIVTWFAKEGVNFSFQNIKISNIFVDKKTGNFFLKAEFDRTINGTSVNGMAATGTTKLDLYIKYVVANGEISAKPIIFSVTEHLDNLSSFTTAEVKEKTDNSATLSKDTKEIDEITKAAAEQEAELKKKQKETDQANFAADSVAENAKKAKKKYMNDRYGLRLSPRLYTSRLVEGVLQVGFAKNIIGAKNFELAASLSYGMQFKAITRQITFADSVRNDSLYDKMHFWNNAKGYVFRAEVHMHFKQNKWYIGYMFNQEGQVWNNTYYLQAGTEVKYDVKRNAQGHYFMIGALFSKSEAYVALGLNNISYTTENIPTTVPTITKPADVKKSVPSLRLGIVRKFNF